MRRGAPRIDQAATSLIDCGAAADGQQLKLQHQLQMSTEAGNAHSLQRRNREGALEEGQAAIGNELTTTCGPALMEADETLLTAKISSVCMQPDDDQVVLPNMAVVVVVVNSTSLQHNINLTIHSFLM